MHRIGGGADGERGLSGVEKGLQGAFVVECLLNAIPAVAEMSGACDRANFLCAAGMCGSPGMVKLPLTC
jgi:hypothetical protein